MDKLNIPSEFYFLSLCITQFCLDDSLSTRNIWQNVRVLRRVYVIRLEMYAVKMNELQFACVFLLCRPHNSGGYLYIHIQMRCILMSSSAISYPVILGYSFISSGACLVSKWLIRFDFRTKMLYAFCVSHGFSAFHQYHVLRFYHCLRHYMYYE